MTGAGCERHLLDTTIFASVDANAARGSNRASLGPNNSVTERLASDTTRRSDVAGLKLLTGAAGGQSEAHADVDLRASPTGGSTDLLSLRVQDSRTRILPASDTEGSSSHHTGSPSALLHQKLQRSPCISPGLTSWTC